MQNKPNAEQQKLAKSQNRCNQCGVAARDHPSRHMKNKHPDLDPSSFKALKFGEMPIGDLKFCSNYEEMWNSDFEPADDLLRINSRFKKNNDFNKKRRLKSGIKKLLYTEVEELHPLGFHANKDNGNTYEIFHPKNKYRGFNKEEMSIVYDAYMK